MDTTPNKPLRQRALLFSKRFLQVGGRFWCPEFLVEPILRLAYLSRLSSWLKKNPCQPCLSSDYELQQYLVETERLDGPTLLLEMGVFTGDSLRRWTEYIRHPEARFVGFDTFQGLPEDYGVYKAGSYTTGGKLPDIKDPRCSFEVGLFQQTVPAFLKKALLDRRMVMHLDADLYSSTLYVLTAFAPYWKSGDIIVFDDFASVRVPIHVFRAFDDFCSAYHLRYRMLASAITYAQVALRIE